MKNRFPLYHSKHTMELEWKTNKFPLYHSKRTMELEWKTKALPGPNTVPIITIIVIITDRISYVVYSASQP